MFLFKAYSYGAIAEEEHIQSIELVQSFVAKLSQAASSDQHIAFRYSKLLRSLLRQGLSNDKSQGSQADYYLQNRASLSAQASPSPYIPPGSAEGPVGQGAASADRDSAMDLFHVSPEDTSYTAASFGNQALWPFPTGTTGAFYDFPFPAIGGEGPNNLDFLTF